MAKPLKRVCVTGSAGQIAYNLLFRMASGEMFGHDQPLALHLVELPDAIEMLEGVKMELEDCAFPLIKEIHSGSNCFELFQGIHYAILIGAKPRGPGMERSELLKDNGKIFLQQGQALNQVADKNVKVLVVGNPCNTNCLIAMSNAPNIPRKNFHAMMRLDQNRAAAQLAKKAQVSVKDIHNMIIWGNHSVTQVPDFFNATINEAPVTKKISDIAWLEGEFFSIVQKRGAAVIAARGKSSAASAAQAIIDAIRALIVPTHQNRSFSSAVCSDGNPYGIEENLVFSFPCRSAGEGKYEIVKDLLWNDFLINKIKATEKELIEERELVSQLIKQM